MDTISIKALVKQEVVVVAAVEEVLNYDIDLSIMISMWKAPLLDSERLSFGLKNHRRANELTGVEFNVLSCVWNTVDCNFLPSNISVIQVNHENILTMKSTA